MDVEKVSLGCLLLAISCLVVAQSLAVALRGPLSAAALGAIAVGTGTLLVDAVSA